MPIFGNLCLSVGAMKAGTTWLYAVLERHPELYFTPEKEIHYFYHRFVSPDLLNDRARLKNLTEKYLPQICNGCLNIDRAYENLHWAACYANRPVDDFWFRALFHMRAHHKWACEFSNLNAHLPPEAWHYIVQNTRRLKVIYTIRDPLERLWSHVKFQLQIKGQTDCLDSWSPQALRNFARQDHIWRNGEYGQVLKTLRECLPPDSLKVLSFKSMHEDPHGTLKEIERFLQISPHDYPSQLLSSTPTKSIAKPMPAFFADIFAEDVQRIRKEVQDLGYSAA